MENSYLSVSNSGPLQSQCIPKPTRNNNFAGQLFQQELLRIIKTSCIFIFHNNYYFYTTIIVYTAKDIYMYKNCI